MRVQLSSNSQPYYAQRELLLQAFRENRKVGDVSDRVVEDLPENIVKVRTGLYPFLNQCYGEGKKVHFKLDKLVVDGQSFHVWSSTE